MRGIGPLQCFWNLILTLWDRNGEAEYIYRIYTYIYIYMYTYTYIQNIHNINVSKFHRHLELPSKIQLDKAIHFVTKTRWKNLK